ncbi:UDP-2,3-diacylglucosamine diphosphatase [Xenorhabdus szentirmaii]|uniref:UDP-2,3-diacylglucosamine hydrolase n=2 Tax=Xenorhabdus szentirmaii TaxID=290112 RepID=W1IXL4_9GAMM|nr:MULTISPECIES: UDP-2,3-diacylglucosamine diphosphatase [Xenorhabdus]MBD2779443.1 UDP-2,3-diacylglucosamine diphosphatase [Xenorhabdus sp. 38]MBD2799196.1 UDP-2,3-diacylglucosamine diphosphatase [Xenorhabdus sp. M]PHM33671.1 UDP-2,3 diacylglucosamine hydrolase [Xenorhabdus szentirmaii DSM 16338]PHM42407.1 UDP-2,3 diacylglucosamine hydrolase [Xenorhabdus szentirmaii]CDL83199.1 UDP-2,3-diacylglucosamine hydrolase [Xenorhabdus szentirmaii DSM 16338]
MSTLLIADLHLSEQEPAITAGFLRFLREEAIHAERLYILGDFFNYWIGDDDPNPFHTKIAKALYELKQKGIPCYFIHGNRDFLLGSRFAKESGLILLPQETVLELYDKRILILHGDTLCTDDIGYQQYRKRVHTPWIQRLFLLLPLFIRLKIAAKMRAGSQSANSKKSEEIMDVNQQAVVECFKKYQVDWIIHGHTHRPAIHDMNVDDKTVYRGVLGAWHEQGSMFKVTKTSVELISFPF